MSKLQLLTFFVYCCLGLFFDGCGSLPDSNSLKKSDRSVSPTPTPDDTAPAKTEAERLSVARGLQAQGKAEEALEVYRTLVETNHPESIEIHRSMAEILTGLRRFGEASSHYQSLLREKPEDARAHFAYANLLIVHMKDCQEGLLEAKLSKDLFGDDGLAYVRDLMIAKGYDCLGHSSKARSYYKSFVDGASFAPDSEDYKSAQKRLKELEKSN